MYLKSKGRNIVISERTRQPMGWPGAAQLAAASQAPPLSALALPSSSPNSWQSLASQSGANPLDALRSSTVAPNPNANPLAALLNRPWTPVTPGALAPQASSGGSFFGNLLSGIQGAAQNLIQGGVNIGQQIGGAIQGGGTPAAPQSAPQASIAGGGIGMGTVLMVGGAGLAAYLLLKKKKA